jgi:hypothetical protein
MKGAQLSATWAKCFVYLASTSANEPRQGQLNRNRLVQDQAVFSSPCDFLREQEQLRAKIRQLHEGEGWPRPNRTY